MTTIVIVDDHAPFRERARAMLSADGFDVVGDAADAETGLALARALRPRIVLVDVGLPDRDGFSVASALASVADAPTVVLTSSRDATAFAPRLEASPAAGFIAKDDLSGDAIRAIAGLR